MVGDGRSAGTPEAPWGPPWHRARPHGPWSWSADTDEAVSQTDDPADLSGPFDHRRPRLFLAIVTALVAVVGTLGAAHGQPDARPLDPLAVALLLVPPVVLATIPRRHLLAVSLSLAATGTFLLLGYPWGPVFVPTVAVLAGVMLAGPAAHGRAVAWSGVVVLAGITTAAATLRGGPPSVALLGGLAWTVVALVAANGVRGRAARMAALRAARREHEVNAVTAERLRIARELHDVLAHSLSAITVQAGVGLHLLDRDPEQARAALTAIRATSRESLDEVRAVLGIVRAEGGEAPRSPSWDLGALPRLVGQVPGVAVDLTVEDPAHDASARLAGIVFRVVQESLTNVQRHATGATHAVVDVRVTGTGPPRTLVVTVSDDGAPVPGRAADASWPRTDRVPEGYGLRGMRERVTDEGGTLTAGPLPQGGFVVEARIPWEARDVVGQEPSDAPTPADGPPHDATTRAPVTSDDRPSPHQEHP
ncbi:sensor histidine kinase [Oerskovia sp. KBS0722]|uniref:sensor histidine kinase n=1 Tax=Oerskovia sp. KBS0722 TaxID=1179673 RepID=UPI00110E01B0|nr:sensor histidine kinase [Oerskovia sp. KBS0722]QDW61546.1 sensor histidine kinase [Oerskovia sp. KBS0722]